MLKNVSETTPIKPFRIETQPNREESKQSNLTYVTPRGNILNSPDRLKYSSPTRTTIHINSSPRSSPFLQHKINSAAISVNGTDKKYIYTNGDVYEGWNRIIGNSYFYDIHYSMITPTFIHD